MSLLYLVEMVAPKLALLADEIGEVLPRLARPGVGDRGRRQGRD